MIKSLGRLSAKCSSPQEILGRLVVPVVRRENGIAADTKIGTEDYADLIASEYVRNRLAKAYDKAALPDKEKPETTLMRHKLDFFLASKAAATAATGGERDSASWLCFERRKRSREGEMLIVWANPKRLGAPASAGQRFLVMKSPDIGGVHLFKASEIMESFTDLRPGIGIFVMVFTSPLSFAACVARVVLVGNLNFIITLININIIIGSVTI